MSQNSFTLYLLRHAKSSWDHPDLTDEERPLSERGLINAPKMGERLAKLQVNPDLILSSPADRAISTARLIAPAINYPQSDIKTLEALYHASDQQLLRLCNQFIEPELSSLMLVGHNPGLTDFSNMLCDEQIDNIPTCGFVKITLNIGNAVKAGSGKLILFEYPRRLKA